jgi:hypothetical protein
VLRVQIIRAARGTATVDASSRSTVPRYLPVNARVFRRANTRRRRDDARPPGARVEQRRCRRAGGPAEEKEPDVKRVEPAARRGVERVDRLLSRDERRLHREIDRHRAACESPDASRHERQRETAGRDEKRRARERTPVARIAEAPGHGSDQRARGADERERADPRLTQPEGRRGEPKRDRRPKRAEDRKHRGLIDHAAAQHGLPAEDRHERTHQRAVSVRIIRHAPRKNAREDGDREREQYGGKHVHGAPARDARHEARDGAREQDAEDQAAHHLAHDAPARLGRREVRGERHEHLRDDRRHADRERRREKERERGRRGRGDERRRRARHDREDEAPVLDEVAERHEREQSARVPDLRDRDDEARGRVADSERRPDRLEQRLRVIDVPDGEAACDREDRDRAAAQVRLVQKCRAM